LIKKVHLAPLAILAPRLAGGRLGKSLVLADILSARILLGEHFVMEPNPYEPPKEHGQTKRPSAVSKKKEILEWLSLAPGDIPVWAAGAALLGLYFAKATILDTVLALTAVVLALVGCVIGMKTDPELSSVTNAAKIVLYPAVVVVCLIVIYINFTYWNQ